jgi:hypothetical protein
MKKMFLLLLTTLAIESYSQDNFSSVEIEGQKIQVLTAKSGDIYKSGKLSTGEIIKTSCDHGACDIKIEYKGKILSKGIGDDISKVTIYEYDLGNDGDKEIIVINEFMDTAYIFIYSYGRGMIQKVFEKEIMYYRTVIKPNHIEYYMPSGLDQVWNYYQGQFWSMSQIKLSDY